MLHNTVVLLDTQSFTLKRLLNEHYICCVMEDVPKVPYCFLCGSRHVSRVNNRKRPKYRAVCVHYAHISRWVEINN